MTTPEIIIVTFAYAWISGWSANSLIKKGQRPAMIIVGLALALFWPLSLLAGAVLDIKRRTKP